MAPNDFVNSSHGKLSVAVIGTGPAGLTVLYVLQKHGNFDVVAYERADSVGGEWYIRDDDEDRLENGFPM